jgi:hypothetical protein
MKRKFGFILGSILILGISLFTLIPMVKSYTSTEELPDESAIGTPLPQLAEGDVLRWSFQTHDGQFYVRVWVEDDVTYETDTLSEGLIQDNGEWTVPSELVGDDCYLWFENLGWQDGYIDIYYELNPEPEPQLIPSFNLFFLIVIFSVVTICAIKKVKKSLI